MNSLIKGIERDYMIIASIFSLFIIAASLTNFAYSQPSQMASNSSNEDNTNANSVNIQDIPTKKVHVGDIDIASRSLVVKYRMFDRMYEEDENYGYDINEDEIAESVLPYIVSMQDIYSRIYPAS